MVYINGGGGGGAFLDFGVPYPFSRGPQTHP